MGKIAACFLYVVCSIIYLSPIATNTFAWGAFNVITQVAFIGYLSYLQSVAKANTTVERLFYIYLYRLCIVNCIYVLACLWRGKDWSIYNTSVFAYILGVSFLILLIHIAILQHNDDDR